jgi:hypothetical protein
MPGSTSASRLTLRTVPKIGNWRERSSRFSMTFPWSEGPAVLSRASLACQTARVIFPSHVRIRHRVWVKNVSLRANEQLDFVSLLAYIMSIS